MFPPAQGPGSPHGIHEALRLLQGSGSVGNDFGFPVTSDSSSVINTVEYGYDMGGEGDLFKRPEPVAEQPREAPLDPVTAALSLMSGGDLVAGDGDALDVAGIGSGQLSEFLYGCENEDARLAPEPEAGGAFPEHSDGERREGADEATLQESGGSGLLATVYRTKGRPPRPSFLGFEGMALGAPFGIRRARSDGDIQTPGNGGGPTVVGPNAAPRPSSPAAPVTTEKFKSEERRQKLSRYRNKRERRNFRRKITYACRKVLADSQLRVRGRFARVEERRASKAVN